VVRSDRLEPACGWEERAAWAVAETGDQDLAFGRTALALEISARETAGGGVLVAVIDGEREEVLAGFGLARRDGGDHDDGFTHLDGHSAVSLFGEFPCFDNDLLVPDRGGGFFRHTHNFCPLPPRDFSESRNNRD
jgi:hypothetical protein